ncbi:MAG: hypothetical protein L0Z55_01485, partial [Planctomycetes bacterium]|nr:hypothetical protein [Planctomycetota bacterium]
MARANIDFRTASHRGAARAALVAAICALALSFGCSKSAAPAGGDSAAAAPSNGSGAESAESGAASLAPANTDAARVMPSAKGAESAEVAAARSAATAARAAAEKANAQRLASEEYQSASIRELEATTYEADDAAAAVAAFRDAERGFQGAERSAKDASVALLEVEGLTANYEALRKEAAILQAEEHAPELWKSAANAYERSRKQIEKASFAPHQAKESLIRATADLKTAIASIRDYSVHKDRLMKVRSKVYESYSLSNEAQLERYASVEYGEAVAEKGRGDRAWEKREYVKALGHYETAEASFARAFEIAKKARPPEEETALVPRKKTDGARAGGAGSGGGEGGDGDGDGDGGGGGTEPAPEAERVDKEPQGPSEAEIAAKLTETLHGAPKFEKGVLALVYEKPADFQLDCEIQQGTPSENVQFDVRNSWRYWREIFAFAGHTRGHLLHSAEFDGDVTVRCQVEFDILVDNPEFQVILNSDGRTFCASQFCTDIRQFVKGKPKG